MATESHTTSALETMLQDVARILRAAVTSAVRGVPDFEGVARALYVLWPLLLENSAIRWDDEGSDAQTLQRAIQTARSGVFNPSLLDAGIAAATALCSSIESGAVAQATAPIPNPCCDPTLQHERKRRFGHARWISLAEAAESLGVSTSWVRARIADGSFNGRQIQRQWRVARESLVALERLPKPGAVNYQDLSLEDFMLWYVHLHLPETVRVHGPYRVGIWLLRMPTRVRDLVLQAWQIALPQETDTPEWVNMTMTELLFRAEEVLRGTRPEDSDVRSEGVPPLGDLPT